MSTTLIDKNDLLKEGAYIGTLSDFISTEEIEGIRDVTKEIKEHYENNKDIVRCRYMYAKEEDYVHSIPYNKVAERDEYVKANNIKVNQKWFEFFTTRPQFNFFMEISKKILDELYKNIEINYDTPVGGFTVYENGHFIQEHKDGNNPNRVCVVIIYLSEESEYNDGGGELVIKTNSSKEYIIKPIFGTFSVLDFSKNDIYHSVNMVKNDFKRFSFINFFYEKKLENKTII